MEQDPDTIPTLDLFSSYSQEDIKSLTYRHSKQAKVDKEKNLSIKLSKYWEGKSTLEMQRHSRLVSEGMKNMTSTSRETMLRRTSEGQKSFWSRFSEKEKSNYLSDKGKLHYGKPSGLELFVGSYLEDKFPGEWLYNGQGQYEVLGTKIPDFVNSKGRRCVIEVFGSLHTKETVEEKVRYYNFLKYECIVVSGRDSSSREGLDFIFKEPLKGNWPSRFDNFDWKRDIEFRRLIKVLKRVVIDKSKGEL